MSWAIHEDLTWLGCHPLSLPWNDRQIPTALPPRSLNTVSTRCCWEVEVGRGRGNVCHEAQQDTAVCGHFPPCLACGPVGKGPVGPVFQEKLEIQISI